MAKLIINHTASLLLFLAFECFASPIVATPGSLAGYTYFPPGQTSSGSGTGGGSESVSTLQRCLWAPSGADQTVTASNFYDYNKNITAYYKMVGGDGGGGINGGGGGSSAILLNGTPSAIAPGGDGGTSAVPVAGSFSIQKGATIRFVTGGGGGVGNNTAPAVGGGGGAGYKGGGAGASITSRAFTPAEAPSVSGKGGNSNPGQGGFVSGALAGTAGSDMNGGIATFPDGSTTTTGTPSCSSGLYACTYSQSHMYYDFMGMSQSQTSRWPALPGRSGSLTGSMSSGRFGGAGGMLGHGGSPSASVSPGGCQGSNISINNNAIVMNLNDNGACYTWYNMYQFHLARLAEYPQHDFSMNLTRRFPQVASNGSNPIQSTGGSLSGQIILMYQAPMCDLFQ